MDKTMTFFEICMLISINIFWVLVILTLARMKTQLFFQRAYIDIKGDSVDKFLNLKYKHSKIAVQLFKDLPVVDKEGNTSYLTITRISKEFLTVYLSNNRQCYISETMEYLLSLAKELNLEVTCKGYY
jgi:hypothetical protein